jgi:hypothetical protein
MRDQYNIGTSTLPSPDSPHLLNTSSSNGIVRILPSLRKLTSQPPSPTTFSREKTKNSSSATKPYQKSASAPSRRADAPTRPLGKTFRPTWARWKSSKRTLAVKCCLSSRAVIILLVRTLTPPTGWAEMWRQKGEVNGARARAAVTPGSRLLRLDAGRIIAQLKEQQTIRASWQTILST